MRHYDDTRVSAHLLKLAGYTLPGTALGGGAGMLLGGGLGYVLAPNGKKVWPTLLGAAGGGIAGAGIGGSLGLWKDLSNLGKALNSKGEYTVIKKVTPNGTPYEEVRTTPPSRSSRPKSSTDEGVWHSGYHRRGTAYGWQKVDDPKELERLPPEFRDGKGVYKTTGLPYKTKK